MFINGSDVLLYIDSKAVGHCKSHTAEYNTETKEHAFKPEASASSGSSLWRGKSVTALSMSVNFEGFRFSEETELTYADLLAAWKAGKSIGCKLMDRGADTPYATGNFVITKLSESDPGQDDVTYSGTLENDGVITIDTTQLKNSAQGGV